MPTSHPTDGTIGYPDMEQPTSVMQLTVTPSSTLSGRRRERYNGVRVFERFSSAADLTMMKGDMVFQARDDWCVRDIFPFEGVESLIEDDISPFSIFNGMLKPQKEFDAHTTYQFLGILRSGPITFEGLDNQAIAIEGSGIFNYKNTTGRPIQPFTPMTWSIDDREYVAELAGKPDNFFGTRPPSKRRAYMAPLIRGYFLPATTLTLEEQIALHTDEMTKLLEQAKKPKAKPKVSAPTTTTTTTPAAAAATAGKGGEGVSLMEDTESEEATAEEEEASAKSTSGSTLSSDEILASLHKKVARMVSTRYHSELVGLNTAYVAANQIGQIFLQRL